MRKLWLAPLMMIALLLGRADAQPAKIDGIAHVAFRVADLDSARDFYRRLGFEEAFVFTKDDKPAQVFVKINDRQFIELYPPSEEAKLAGWMHVCYETDMAEALNALYGERGLNPTPVKKGGAGNFVFSLYDPMGSTVEITQYLPGSRHSEDRGKHLGADRISDALQEVKITAPDLSAAEQFYGAGLGLEKQEGAWRVSGDQRLELEPANTPPQLVFRVANARKAAARLKALGVAVTRHKRLVQVSDPDGNILVFQQKASRPKL
jgi:catechol 2,3-dioxygenase-like lactoylglutathione lyase family enzyme